MAKKKTSEFDKLQPNAVEMEVYLLGSIFMDKELMYEVIEIISTPDAFYDNKNRIIYQAMLDLTVENKPIDAVTVYNYLKEKNLTDEIGGAIYITNIQEKVTNTAHTEYYAKIIMQKYLQRKLIQAANKILENAYNDEADVSDLLDESEKLLLDVAEGQLKQQTDPVDIVVREVIKDIESAAENEGMLRGVPSGFEDIDKITNGWQPGNFIIIAARPSMGKTAFALNLIRNAAVEYGIPAAIFSLEMGKKELVRRFIAGETRIDSMKLIKGELDESEWEKLHTRVEKIIQAPIYINDSNVSVFELRAIARRLKKKYDIKLLVVDYLQLMNADNIKKNTNREQEVSIISRSLKSLAKELDLPIIALSQLNRELEKRSERHKRPQLSDLRESGAIEQDADMVLFIHRPERLGITEVQIDDETISTEGLAEIIIAKNRNGMIGTVKLKFIGQYTQFTNWDEDDISFGDEPQVLASHVNEEESLPPELGGDTPIIPPDDNNFDDAPF